MVAYSSYEWEGKGLKYYLKDTLRYRPQMLFLIPVYGLIIPAACVYLYLTEDEERLRNSRFKSRYLVYRDDDPRVSKIVKLDENGDIKFLKPVGK